jgi:NADH-quinone oxidoreductase subunit C
MDKAAFLTALEGALAGGLLAAEEEPGLVTLAVRPEALLPLARAVRVRPLGLEVLLDLTCLDDPAAEARFTLVYHFASFEPPARLRVKVPLTGAELEADSLTPHWPNAAWLEREVYDLFGVRFRGHPGLRRLFLREGFEGHPLRKDYPLRRRQPAPAGEDEP